MSAQAAQVEDNANAISAERIWRAIAENFADCNQDPATLMTYALCDIRHLCDLHGLDYAQKDKEGYAHYVAEKQERS